MIFLRNVDIQKKKNGLLLLRLWPCGVAFCRAPVQWHGIFHSQPKHKCGVIIAIFHIYVFTCVENFAGIFVVVVTIENFKFALAVDLLLLFTGNTNSKRRLLWKASVLAIRANKLKKNRKFYCVPAVNNNIMIAISLILG